MYPIVARSELAERSKRFVFKAPDIAKKVKAGQFVIVRIDEHGERIPLTVAEADRKKGTITIIFQEVGKTTYHLGTLQVGDGVMDLVGPLGKPTPMEKHGTVVCVGGGIGIAALYPIARALKDNGNTLISILGARNKELLILEEEMRAISEELIITTDDGSYGQKGLVTDALKQVLDRGKPVNLVVSVGPTIMMRATCQVTKPYGVKTLVSLNPIMVDGTGMCGVCRVTVGGQRKFACVDGPDFDGHQVDFDEMMQRCTQYCDKEKLALERYLHGGRP